jgi:outer membrane receptor for ferrienterochelin and colicin
MRFVRTAVFIGVPILLSTPTFAQVVATGSLSGIVKSTDGASVPGATVSAASADLQGQRIATTSSDGHYIVPLLPPGDYIVSFGLTGFQTTKERVRIGVGEDVALAVTLHVAAISQTVDVDARNLSEFSANLPAVSTFSQGDFVEKLPLDRTPSGTVRLAPDVQATGPSGNLVISGSVSYESLYLVNGVVVNDNQSGQPNPLFIEDAIQESAVITAGISAEFGRFSGGVVNVVTRSGGNDFTGSFRTTFTNDSWTSLTPFPGDSRVKTTVPTYEATAGGRILTDRLWFFGAARHADTKNSATTSLTNIPYVFENDETRYEGKLTYAIAPQHTVKASLTKIDLAQRNRSSGTFLDLASLGDRTNPQRLISANYGGVLAHNTYLEGQWSERTYSLDGSGAKTTDLLGGTVLYDRQLNNARYHAPTSCGVCTSEHRDNWDVLVKATHFLTTSRAGSHSIIVGADVFNDRRYDNQFPTASTYGIFGTSILTVGNTIYPVFVNDGTTFIRWTPIFVPTQGTAFRTYSGFANDAWHPTDHLSVNLGLRFDKNGGTDSVGNPVIKDQAWSPRLGLSWNPDGQGVWTLSGGVAQYVAGMLVTVADGSSPGGRAAQFDFAYLGPSINTNVNAPLVDQDAAIQTALNWFNQNGGTNRPTRGAPSVPGLTTVIGGTSGSPKALEYTVGATRKLGTFGEVRVDGIYRDYENFYSNRVDLTTGRVTNSVGQTFDLAVVDNTSDLTRTYRAMRAQVSLRPASRVTVGANYALSKAFGNFDGETFPSGGQASATSETYPEYTQVTWNRPTGDLSIDQRHRVRAWTTVGVPLGSPGDDLNIGVIEWIDSGTPYGAVGVIDPRPYVQNPGYVNPPATEAYYFTARDAFRTASASRTDLAVVYAHRVNKAELFVRATVVNIFNQAGISNGGAVDQSILTANNTSSLQRFNPFTSAPVRGVNWDYGPNFGKPLTRLAYQTPRTAGFSLGFRF